MQRIWRLLHWRYLTREQIKGFDNYKVGVAGVGFALINLMSSSLYMDTVQRHRHVAAQPTCNASILGLAGQGECRQQQQRQPQQQMKENQ